MKIREFDCPSCGASLQIKKGQKTLSCPYCDSTVIVPDSFSSGDSSGHSQQTTPVTPTVVFDSVLGGVFLIGSEVMETVPVSSPFLHASASIHRAGYG